jgi:hypothetical protein
MSLLAYLITLLATGLLWERSLVWPFPGQFQ